MTASVPVVAAALASDTSWAVTVAGDGTVRTWASGVAATVSREMVHLEAGEPVAVAFSDPVVRVLWVSEEKLRLYERGSGARPGGSTIPTPASVRAVAFSPSGDVAVVACDDGTLRGLDVRVGEFSWTLATGAQPVQAVPVASDGGPVVAVFADGSIIRFDLEAGTSTTVGVGPPAHSVAVTPDGETVVTAIANGALLRWNPRTGMLPETRRLGEAVAVVVINGTGDRVLAGTDNGRLWLHDLTGGPSIEYIIPAEEHPGEVVTAPAEPHPSHPAPVVDDDVRFTVYRPQTLFPGEWGSLLVFAHKTDMVEEPGHAPVDPTAEVEARAHAHFGGAPPRPVAADAQQELTRGAQLRIVPDLPGILCNPAYAKVDWWEPVHEAMFRLLAGS
jgi:WD40 repeat protein